MLALVGFADVVQLGRGHHRVQSAATQNGQIVSQCRRLSDGDQKGLAKLTGSILGKFAGPGKEWSLLITAEGWDADDNRIYWVVEHVQKPGSGTTPAKPETRPNLPQFAYAAQTSEVVYKTHVSAVVETNFFAKDNPALQRLLGSQRDGRAYGFAMHTTRRATVDELENKNMANASEDCLRAQES